MISLDIAKLPSSRCHDLRINLIVPTSGNWSGIYRWYV